MKNKYNNATTKTNPTPTTTTTGTLEQQHRKINNIDNEGVNDTWASKEIH
jgi:hypothetical protein